MRKFIVFIALLVCGMVWLKDWASSGKMDAYIASHAHPEITPKVLRGLGEFHFMAQEHKEAIYYLKWLLQDYPDYPQADRIHWQLGRSYEGIGNRNGAMEQFTILKDSYTLSEYGQMGHNRYSQLKY